MDSIVSIAATVFGLFVFLQAFTLILTSARLVKLPFRSPSFTTVPRAEAGAELPYLDAARAILEKEGFEYVSTRRVRSLVATPSMPAGYTDVYYHAGRDVHAEACAAALPSPRWPFDIFLWDTYTDGSALLTVNGLEHHLLVYPKNITIADAYAPTFALQLAHHMGQRAQRSGQRTDPAEAAALATSLNSATMPAMVNEGKAYILGSLDGEPVYALRLFTAVKATLRIRGSMGRRKAMLANPGAGDVMPEAAPDARHASEKRAFVGALLTLNGLRAPRWFRWSAFVVSAGAFVALGTWWWGLSAALVIGAVVAVHEAGHWLAMRLGGFRDVQVFFVPGMGAATSGEKHDANPLTHLAVYLAGPMPGLLAGMAGIAWMLYGQVDSGAWWYPTFVTAIGAAFLINLLNLVPVMPLDGGRVIDLFVMGRLPWFRFAFGLASGAALLWVGYLTGDKVIGGLGLLSLLALPHQYRMAKVARDLLRQTIKTPFAPEDFAAAAARLFDFLAQPAYKHWTFEAKMSVGQQILPRFLGRLPNLKETLLGLSIYLVCILLPLVLLLAFAVREPHRFQALSPFANQATAPIVEKDMAQVQRERSAARLAAASGPAQRLAVLRELLDEAHEYDDSDEEERLAVMLYGSTASFPLPSRERAEAAYKLAIALRSKEDKQSLQQIASLLAEAEISLRARLARQDDSADALLLANVIGERLPSAGPVTKLAILREIVDLHAAHWEQSAGELPGARTSLARALDVAGRKAEAEEQLVTAQGEAARLPKRAQYAVQTLALNHGWFLMSSQRPQEAVRRLASYLSQPVSPRSGWYSFDRETYMLAAIAARSRGDWQEVKARTAPLQVFTHASGNWLVNYFRPKKFDLRAGLLLVEAERKLGRAAAADQLVDDMRAQYLGKKNGTPTCRFGSEYDSWRQELASALGENEKREFKCEEPAPPLSCPAPVVPPAEDPKASGTKPQA